MLSARLIHLIETHHKELADRVLREIWRRQDLPHILRLPEAELRERNRLLLEHLGEWLLGNEEKMRRLQESVGTKRFEQSVPLQEELEHRLGKFFDQLIIHLVRGYEGAWRRAIRAAA